MNPLELFSKNKKSENDAFVVYANSYLSELAKSLIPTGKFPDKKVHGYLALRFELDQNYVPRFYVQVRDLETKEVLAESGPYVYFANGGTVHFENWPNWIDFNIR